VNKTEEIESFSALNINKKILNFTKLPDVTRCTWLQFDRVLLFRH
jgi:hypothetical protein